MFAIVLFDIDHFKAVNDQFGHSVAAQPLLDRQRVTVSCGVAAARAHDNIDSLLQRADAALYAAKRAGRNQVCIAD